MFPRHFPTPAERAAYRQRCQQGPCFICELIAGSEAQREHIVYRDDIAIAFLNKYPSLYGYTLVAPIAHLEQVAGDFTVEQYLALQRVIYRVSEALRRVVPCERLYLLSLGSQQGNRHVHWHLAPLPPGVPYDEQQLAALAVERGILQIPEKEMASLARRIREALAGE